MLTIEYLDETIDVYDITVEDNHNFYANGILVHNCCEINLPTKPLQHVFDGAPETKIIKMTKEDYEKFKIWRKNNPKTNIKRRT